MARFPVRAITLLPTAYPFPRPCSSKLNSLALPIKAAEEEADTEAAAWV